MKRSLVAATAAALLLAGCATGETGHLDPEIEPDLIGPLSTPAEDSGAETGGTPEDLAEAVDEDTAGTAEGDRASEEPGEGDATSAPGTSAAPGNDVEAAFAQAAGGEAWFEDVTAVDVDGDSVLVTTVLTEAGADAVAVCEAALEAAESTGIAEPSVEVRSGDGETLSGRDAAAGGEGCSG